MKKIFFTVALLAGLFLTYEAVSVAVYLFSSPSKDETLKIILIEPGTFRKTADQLNREGFVPDVKRFILVARLLGKTSSVRVGEYELKMNMSPYKLLSIITSGKSVVHAVAIPEGYNIYQIALALSDKKLINADEFVKLAKDPQMAKLLGIEEPTLEGYLYPDTYSFTHFTGEKVIIKTMVDRFKEVYNRDIKFGAIKTNKTMHEVVTLASVIEKETGVPEERPVISSVFHNRLKKGMKLQSDPTVLYGKKGDKMNITREDLKTYSAYNTYVIKGLPKGPIANPGREAMIAAIEPAQTNFLYFVSKNNGTHYFSETLNDHNKAVQKYQRNPKSRAGRSWREFSEKHTTKN
ncbi:MAG: endolytic transglycosylase MltG [Oligoflexia bacterium]|nr:endolytic transglycosylase MltG [Oligoflexia bacterium]